MYSTHVYVYLRVRFKGSGHDIREISFSGRIVLPEGMGDSGNSNYIEMFRTEIKPYDGDGLRANREVLNGKKFLRLYAWQRVEVFRETFAIRRANIITVTIPLRSLSTTKLCYFQQGRL